MKLPRAPRYPFLGLVVAAATGILIADYHLFGPVALVPVTVVAGICGLALILWSRLALTYLFVAISFFLLHSLETTHTTGQWLAARLGDHPRAVNAVGVIVTEPKIATNGFATFLLQLESIELEGKSEKTQATMLVRWKANPAFGDELKLFGIAQTIAPPRNPGEFDMRSYLARQDVYRRLSVRYPEDGTLIRHGGGNPILRVAQNCRGRIQAILCRGLDDAPDVQNFISGIALGLRHQTTDDIEEPFQQTGTLHLFAVAGLHVGIVAQLLFMLSSVTRLSRKWAAALIIPLLFFYAAVTGLHISSVRAAVMSAILLGGFFVERKVFPLNSLAAAAFLFLCLNSNELFSTGFQLSFAVVGAIILLSDPVARWMRRWTSPDPFLPRSLLRGRRLYLDESLIWLGKGTSVSVAAWIGSLLLILWYFHLVTPVSLFANLAVVPIAFFILAIALLSLISAPVLPWLSILFNQANWCLAKIVLGLVHLFAQFPGGHHYLEHPHWPDGARVRIEVLDLGAGAAVHVRARRGGDWLFDCGSDRDYERVVREYLHTAGVNSLRGLLLTHGDSLHIGGTARLVSEYRPETLIDNPLPDRSIVHRRLRKLFEQVRLSPNQMAVDDSFELGAKVTAKILYPGRLCLANAVDDQCFVVQLKISPSTSVLLMSDSGPETEKALLLSGADLRSDIVVKGQHPHGGSGSIAFLDAAQPRLIIATSQDFPEHERIPDEWADMVRAHGIKLFRQDETGAVQLRFWQDGWEARAYANGEIFRSSSR
jgi:competence protein ComEC